MFLRQVGKFVLAVLTSSDLAAKLVVLYDVAAQGFENAFGGCRLPDSDFLQGMTTANSLKLCL